FFDGFFNALQYWSTTSSEFFQIIGAGSKFPHSWADTDQAVVVAVQKSHVTQIVHQPVGGAVGYAGLCGKCANGVSGLASFECAEQLVDALNNRFSRT